MHNHALLCFVLTGVHAARARRRLRTDHSVELSASDAGVEAGPRSRVRVHRRDEAQ